METKKFGGAPFGVQTSRFNVTGIHPRSKPPGTFTQVPYDSKSTDEKMRRRGPGMYKPDLQGFHPRAVEQRASGPGWARQQEVETIAAMPHLLHRELYEQRKEQKRKLGPGSYNFKDFTQLQQEKPRSTFGICEPRADRFGRPSYSITPGPGTYGKHGIPHTAMEEKNRKSASTKGMLDAATGSRIQFATGCPLGPGTYSFVDSIDQFLNKVVSLRGPYDLFSGDRTKPISTGHFAAPKFTKLGPGQYEIKPFMDEWSEKHKEHKGKFGKVAQYPRPPAERNYQCVLSQCPKEQYFPGPGAYSPSCAGDWPKVQNYSKRAAFLSSAERMDRRAQRFFTGNFNSVGVGRYNIRRFEEAQHYNGHQNIFKSKGVWNAYPTETFLRERVRGKDIPIAERNIPAQVQGLPSEDKKRHMYSFQRQITGA